MPSKQKHLAKADHNKIFIESLDLKNSQFKDWGVTGYFYAALHLVDSYFAEKYNKHFRRHKNRDDWIQKCLPQCFDDYRSLKDASVGARYNMRNFTSDEITKRIVPKFNNLEKNVRRQLK